MKLSELTYHDKEKAVYEFLKKDLEETGYYFSLRKNGSKNARRDIFIGTETSNYFMLSLWEIPIAYPGSAGDFIDYTFYQMPDTLWNFRIEAAISKAATGDQNNLSKQFLQQLFPTLKENFPDYYCNITNEEHKTLWFELRREMGYAELENLLNDLKSFIQKTSTFIDKQISSFQIKNPEWEARRFTLNDWNKFNDSYQKRLQRYPIIEKDIEEDLKEEIVEQTLDIKRSFAPLNQILFGPPGTGKTYNTVKLALNILGYSDLPDRESEMAMFEKERKAGKITFTTFHQSMSYEDFVEGIKPVLDDSSEGISYQIQDGILKTVSKLAIQEFLKWRDEEFIGFEDRYQELLDTIIESDDGKYLKTRTGSKIILKEVTDRGNIKVEHEHGSRSYIVSKSRLEKVFLNIDPNSNYPNINLAIRNVIGGSNATVYWAVNEYLHAKSGPKKNYEIKPDLSDAEFEKIINTVDWKEAKDFDVDRNVIIIDEINRGNVAGIFGELITLLEDDKRIDSKNKLILKLPYSKISFSLPSNLYIIGTMNTADRSVEALDSALRRRFSFKEIMPQPKVIERQNENEGSDVIEDISLVDLLTTINDRIRILIDRDHQIGHSYFLGINNEEELKGVFKNKIIPLLQEYFYNDYYKLLLVLGQGFIEEQEERSNNIFAISDYEISIIDKTYNLKAINQEFNIMDAIRRLLNIEIESIE